VAGVGIGVDAAGAEHLAGQAVAQRGDDAGLLVLGRGVEGLGEARAGDELGG